MSRPVRVLHIIDDLGGGGSQQLLWDLVRLADSSKVRHQVVSLTVDRGDFVYADRLAAAGVYRPPRLAKTVRRAAQPVWVMSAQPQKSLRQRLLSTGWSVGRGTRLVGMLSSAIARFRPDVIHAHVMRSLPAALALKKIFRLPVMHSVPCVVSQMVDINAGWLADIYRERHNEIDMFIASASVHELQQMNIPDRKIRPAKGGVDVSAIAVAVAQRDEHRLAIRREIGADEGSVVALSVGRLHRLKGHDFALEALPAILRALPNAHWVVLGVGEEERALRERARELGVESRMHLLGYRDDPRPYYAAADVYLRTNVHESENLCSYQAMAAGLPVVGFDTGRETELIPTVGHGALVAVGDAGALAARVIELLSSADGGRALGERGRRYAHEHLDSAASVRTCVDAYVALSRHG